MATHIGLGSRMVTAAADQTGRNKGNWTNAFTAAVLGINVPFFEVYRGVVTGAPAGAAAVIEIGTRQISFTAPGGGGGSEWDPAQPPIMTPGQEMDFLWSAAAAGTPPVVTLWFRYDLDVILAANKGLLRDRT
jgi:hypothetical protein